MHVSEFYPSVWIKSMLWLHRLLGITHWMKCTFCQSWPVLSWRIPEMRRKFQRHQEIILRPRLGEGHCNFFFFFLLRSLLHICMTLPIHTCALTSGHILKVAPRFLVNRIIFLYIMCDTQYVIVCRVIRENISQWLHGWKHHFDHSDQSYKD